MLWYASYGSNMSRARFACYLEGGSLPGTTRVYEGARDTRPPADERALWLDGDVYFAHDSTVWGGGVAFLDPDAEGRAAGRAYLIEREQFLDVIDQEMNRPRSDIPLDLDALVAHGRLRLGPGRYDTLVMAGSIDSVPVLTFTAPEPVRPLNPPTPAYLRMLATGLAEAHQWDLATIAHYLAARPGVGRDATELAELIAG